jgi:hypothetical protein
VHRWAGKCAIAIVFLPILLTLFYVVRLSVELPWSDDWDLFVPPLYHQATGSLHWNDYNAQHNESLMLFPVAASLALARFTGGRMLAITGLSYFFLCSSLVVLFLFFRTLRLPGRWSVLWFLPVSLVFLGWRQSEALLESTHLVNTMSLFFALAALYSCTQASRTPAFFMAAIVSGWIASFSMASGLLIWLPGAIALSAVRRRLAVLWLISAALCAAMFAYDRAPYDVPWETGISYILAHPVDAIGYVLTYFGAALGGTPSQTMWAGAIFLMISVPVIGLSLRKRALAPGLLLASYPLLALLALLDRRLALGMDQAFDSRYVTLAALLPIGVYFSALMLAGTTQAGRWLAAAMVMLMAFGIVSSYRSGWVEGRQQRDSMTACAAAVGHYREVDRQALDCAYPDPDVVYQRAGWLEQYRLSLFVR